MYNILGDILNYCAWRRDKTNKYLIHIAASRLTHSKMSDPVKTDKRSTAIIWQPDI